MEQKIYITDMTCSSCEFKIKKKLETIQGVTVKDISASKCYVIVEYNPKKVKEKTLYKAIQEAGYTPTNKNPNIKANLVLFGILTCVFGLYLIIKNTIGFNYIPNISQNMSYGLLFLAGCLSSLHCVSMCGGIALSQGVSNDRKQGLKNSFLYNSGRILSYTTIGGVVGLLGSILTPSPTFKTGLHIIIGLFMLMLGLKMFGLIQFQLPAIRIFKLRIKNKIPIRTPFFIGVLNGFMPCGPLQTMQIYAMGTASFVVGALSMFSFALGTFFLMFAFGSLGSIINARTNRTINKASAVIIMVLSVVMINRGLLLSGITIPLPNIKPYKVDGPTVQIVDGKVYLEGQNENVSDNQGYAEIKNGKQYVNLVVDGDYGVVKEKIRKGIPVVMNVEAKNLNGCNNPLTIPEYGITQELQEGKNIIEFTPMEAGKVVVTCWMGMIKTYLNVV